jgi:hypothetical protein
MDPSTAVVKRLIDMERLFEHQSKSEESLVDDVRA